MSTRRLLQAAAAAVLIASASLTGIAHANATTAPSSNTRPPVYAYFYQWFEKQSWARAKRDYPLAGRYSSDDPHVLRNQITQARWAGIDGFLTSWKNTPKLDRRLGLLLRMAALTKFDVGVVYEALDFSRNPLPIKTVSSDLSLLVRRWGSQLRSSFGRPVIIWTGTNNYTHAQIAAVHSMLAGRALLLAASKSIADYQKIADVVDGEAYYWSSSDPSSPFTASKLRAFGSAVHAHHQIWIAPAAPGFDGRTLGHARVIARDNGATFTQSLDLATQSSPDALGVISWNEWSENTYIEPGRQYGQQELATLHQYLSSRAGGGAPAASTPARQDESGWTGLRAAGILVLLTSVGITVLIVVRRRIAAQWRAEMRP